MNPIIMMKRAAAAACLASAGWAAAGTPQDSLAVLNARLTALGAPSVTGVDKLGDRLAPVLFFGRRKISGRHDVVDEVRQATGATATVFVRDGDDFLRVSTNQLTPDGKRDLASVLVRGPAQAALIEGKPFCGPAAGTETACYQPLKDGEGRVVGAIGVLARLPRAAEASR